MEWVSVRMRASLRGRHVSGAERIVRQEDIPSTLCELIKRPKTYDQLHLTVERLKDVEIFRANLKISSYTFEDVNEARDFAVQVLSKSGVSEDLARKAVNLIRSGASPEGWNMRGAVLMDINTGERLEEDPYRGVRTVRVDWLKREEVSRYLTSQGYTLRTVDALAIATKNIFCGVLAELCWSDDPNYVTGYVASSKMGYVRISPLKREGDPLGGRVYFVKKEELRKVVECLERKALLLDL